MPWTHLLAKNLSQFEIKAKITFITSEHSGIAPFILTRKLCQCDALTVLPVPTPLASNSNLLA